MSVTLNSEEYIPTQRDQVRKSIDQILDDFMEPLVNFTIIAEIKSLAAASNLPKSFAEHVKFRKTGPNIGIVINTWGTDKKPLAKWFNYGTIRHWIEPVNAKALAFGGGSSNASAIYFLGVGEKPAGTKFSKGHYVSGVPRTEVMERGFQFGKVRLAEEAGKIIQKELKYV